MQAQFQMTFILPRMKLNLAREKENLYWKQIDKTF